MERGLFLFTLLAACHAAPSGPPAVAMVGSERILAPELAAELERVRIESDAEQKLAGDNLAAVRRGVLNELVDRRLLLDEAASRQIVISDKEVADAIAQRSANGLQGESPHDGLSAEELRARTRDQLTIDRFLLREVAARVAVGPDDAKKFYAAHPEEFHRPEQVRVSQIVILRKNSSDLDAPQQAQALRAQIGRGGDFGKLARVHSASPEASRDGDLGWFERGLMPPEFDAACFALKKGQVSDVVESPYGSDVAGASTGLHIFKLMDHRDASQVPFAEVEHSIEEKLQRAAVETAETAFLQKLRARTPVQVFESELLKVM